MTDSWWVMCFYCEAISLCLITSPTECKSLHFCVFQIHIMSHPMINSGWETAFFLLPDNLINCPMLWPTVGKWHCICSFSGGFIMSHPMHNRLWVPLIIIFVRHSHHVSSDGQQGVSQTPVFLLQDSLIMSHTMTNRMWVIISIFLSQEI